VLKLTSNMPEVSGIIFSAFMSSMYDFMGKDGLLSILKFADLDELVDYGVKNDYPKSKNIVYSKFQSFLHAMTEIMGHGTSEILIHYGKNYLGLKLIAYYGSGIEEMVSNFEKWLGGKWTVITNRPEEVVISVENGLFVQEYPQLTSWAILQGVFSCILEQLTGDNYFADEMELSNSDTPSCKFTIRRK